VRRHHPLLKVFALVVVAAFFSLRLSTFSTEVFVVPVEDAIFDVAFIADETGGAAKKPLKIKTKRAIDHCTLVPAENFVQPGEWSVPPTLPLTIPLELKDIRTEIFIPPETCS
jgi:hypothetical protein